MVASPILSVETQSSKIVDCLYWSKSASGKDLRCMPAARRPAIIRGLWLKPSITTIKAQEILRIKRNLELLSILK